jgi:hypothetical protein
LADTKHASPSDAAKAVLNTSTFHFTPPK